MTKHVYDIPADKADSVAQSLAHTLARRQSLSYFNLRTVGDYLANMDECSKDAVKVIQTKIDKIIGR